MKFMGIDQALETTGVCVLAEKTPRPVELSVIDAKNYRGSERLAYIYLETLKLLKKHQPTLVAIEGYAYGATGRVFELGEVGGVVRMSLAQQEIPFVAVAPASLKQFVSGRGGANKRDMRVAILSTWDLDIDEDNKADAYGLAQVAKALVHGGQRRCELTVLSKLTAKHFSERGLDLINSLTNSK